MRYKALLVPYNSKRQIFIQDRTGHTPPPWGFFGGTIEAGEEPIEAMIREAKEELDLDLTPADLIELGNLPTVYDGEEIARYFFVLRTDQEEFTVLEGAGGIWVSFEESKEYLKPADKIEVLEENFNKVV